MTGPRTFTVDTKDRGVLTVTDPEWCTIDHHNLGPYTPERRTFMELVRWPRQTLRRRGHVDYRPLASEIDHVGKPVDITVGGPGGPYRLLELMLWADPYPVPDSPFGTETYVVARFLDGDHVSFDLAGLEGLSADLMEASGSLRLRIRDFAAVINGGDQ